MVEIDLYLLWRDDLVGKKGSVIQLYGYSDMVEDMKVQDHLKLPGRNLIFETISFEQEISNLVLYKDVHEMYL